MSESDALVEAAHASEHRALTALKEYQDDEHGSNGYGVRTVTTDRPVRPAGQAGYAVASAPGRRPAELCCGPLESRAAETASPGLPSAVSAGGFGAVRDAKLRSGVDVAQLAQEEPPARAGIATVTTRLRRRRPPRSPWRRRAPVADQIGRDADERRWPHRSHRDARPCSAARSVRRRRSGSRPGCWRAVSAARGWPAPPDRASLRGAATADRRTRPASRWLRVRRVAEPPSSADALARISSGMRTDDDTRRNPDDRVEQPRRVRFARGGRWSAAQDRPGPRRRPPRPRARPARARRTRAAGCGPSGPACRVEPRACGGVIVVGHQQLVCQSLFCLRCDRLTVAGRDRAVQLAQPQQAGGLHRAELRHRDRGHRQRPRDVHVLLGALPARRVGVGHRDAGPAAPWSRSPCR